MNKWILYCLAGLILMYIFLPEFFPAKKYKADQTLINRIDSLEKANIALQQQFSHYDSLNTMFQTQILELDIRLGGIKEKTTIIKEIYKNKTDQAQKFTPTQVDSFFRDRYNY